MEAEARIRRWFDHFRSDSARFPLGAGSLANFALAERSQVLHKLLLLQLSMRSTRLTLPLHAGLAPACVGWPAPPDASHCGCQASLLCRA